MSNRLMTASLLLSALGLSVFCAAQEAANIPNEVVLAWGDSCDSQNGRLYVENRHTYRTAIATVRWRAAGGKELEAVFVVEPMVMREVGCAVRGAAIVEAELGDF